jgi:hyaluronan synthase
VFIYLLQIREALRGRPGVLIGFAALATLVWIMWAFKTIVSRGYRPWTEPHRTTASVVIPVLDEPRELFNEVLERILKQEPHEVIVVINGPKNEVLEEACIDNGVEWTWTATPGKRNAVRIGTAMASGDIVVLCDSDTIWTDDTLPELLKPFADVRIGGVTTKQRVLAPRRSFLTRWADWMENSRALYSMPAQSTLGYIACLPGRTIAFRRHILMEVMDDFMTGRFLGAFLEVSDDRHLTNLTLKAGYRTVYQETSLVYTDAPLKLRKMYKQQLRWARGSQYNHLRMLPWVTAHAPFLVPFFLADILLPFLLLGSVFGWLYHAFTHTGVHFTQPILDAFPGPTGWALVVALVVIGSTVSMWLRQLRHLAEVPADFLWMPAYVLFSSFFLMPVRILGFCRMAHTAGWGTRADAYKGESHRLNPWAAIPYLAALLMIGAEVALITRS